MAARTHARMQAWVRTVFSDLLFELINGALCLPQLLLKTLALLPHNLQLLVLLFHELLELHMLLLLRGREISHPMETWKESENTQMPEGMCQAQGNECSDTRSRKGTEEDLPHQGILQASVLLL